MISSESYRTHKHLGATNREIAEQIMVHFLSFCIYCSAWRAVKHLCLIVSSQRMFYEDAHVGEPRRILVLGECSLYCVMCLYHMLICEDILRFLVYIKIKAKQVVHRSTILNESDSCVLLDV